MTLAPLFCVAAVAFAPPADASITVTLAGAAAERAAEDVLEAKLDGPPPALPELREANFPEAVAILSLRSGVPALLDRRSFGATDPARVPFTPPPAAAMKAAPTLRAAFGALLDAAGGPPLALENRAGLLRITSPEVAAENLVPRVYDVRGLSEALGLTEADRTRGTIVQRIAGPGAGQEPTRYDPPLIFALKTGVGPAPGVGVWNTDGGPAAIAELGGRLVVRQSPAGHAALARLLADLRASADAQAGAELTGAEPIGDEPAPAGAPAPEGAVQ